MHFILFLLRGRRANEMTRGKADGEWSGVGTFHYVSFVKPVSLAAEIISGSLAFFPPDTCCPFAVIYLLALFSLAERERRWFREPGWTISSETSPVPAIVVWDPCCFCGEIKISGGVLFVFYRCLPRPLRNTYPDVFWIRFVRVHLKNTWVQLHQQLVDGTCSSLLKSPCAAPIQWSLWNDQATILPFSLLMTFFPHVPSSRSAHGGYTGHILLLVNTYMSNLSYRHCSAFPSWSLIQF